MEKAFYKSSTRRRTLFEGIVSSWLSSKSLRKKSKYKFKSLKRTKLFLISARFHKHKWEVVKVIRRITMAHQLTYNSNLLQFMVFLFTFDQCEETSHSNELWNTAVHATYTVCRMFKVSRPAKSGKYRRLVCLISLFIKGGYEN